MSQFVIPHHDRLMTLHHWMVSSPGVKVNVEKAQAILYKKYRIQEKLGNVKRTLDHVSGYEGMHAENGHVCYETAKMQRAREQQEKIARREAMQKEFQQLLQDEKLAEVCLTEIRRKRSSLASSLNAA